MGITVSTNLDKEGRFVCSIKRTDKKSNDIFWEYNKFNIGNKLIKKLGIIVRKDDPKGKGAQNWIIEKICDNIEQKEDFINELRRIKGLFEKLEVDLLGKNVPNEDTAEEEHI